MKKALSVFLSLLMVITTISVVFTLPASAVSVSAFSENFDSLEAGAITTNKEVGSEDGWLLIGSATALVLDPTTDTETYGALTAKSGSNLLSITNWARAGYVFNVEPNTTYTVNVASLGIPPSTSSNRTQISVIDITGVTGALTYVSRGKVKDANATEYVASHNTSYSFASTAALAWHDNTLTFTTGASTNKYFLMFESENNDKTMAADARRFFIDDLSITYNALPKVTASTYGADTANGGVAWIDGDVSSANEGDSITYKAMAYDNALFDGWYVGGEKVGTDTTLTRAWAPSEKVVAKFEALSKNLFPEVENRTTYNTDGAKFTGDAKYTWVSGRGVTHTLIDPNLLTAASCYGYSGTLSSAKAYSGKLSFTPPSAGGHRSYQIVKVEPNTDYTLTFWYYQDSKVLYSGTNNNATIGSINLNLATNPYISETNEPEGSKIMRVTSGGNNVFDSYTNDNGDKVQVRDIGATWSNTAVTGEWAKATATFTSDELGWAVIQFGGGNGVYLDHFTLYEEAVASTPTVTASSNFGTGADCSEGLVQDVTDVYYEGDTFSATAKAFDNATFEGWYVDDEKVSTSETYVFTYDSDATYVAKFDALTKNIFEDGSFEGYSAAANKLPTSGQSASTAGMFVWGTWNGTTQTPTAKGWVGTQYGRGYVASANAVNEIAAGAAPYAGNNVAVGYTGSHAIAKVVPVEANKQYKLVYYTYSLAANAISSAKKDVIGIDMTNGTVANGAMEFSTNGTNGQKALGATYTAFDAATTGKWVRQEATFNSGNFTNVLVQFGVGASQGLMIDHISLFEIPQAFAPAINIDDGGNNAGIVYDVTKVYKDGEEFSATAKAYGDGTENSDFIFDGWYVNEVKVSDAETYTFTYDSTATYTAKFNAIRKNIWPLDVTEGDNTVLYQGSGHVTPKTIGESGWTGQSYATLRNVSNTYINTLKSGLKAYAEDYALYFSSHNGHNAYKIVRGLTPNTQYTLSYWVYYSGLNAKDTSVEVTTPPTYNDKEASGSVNYGITAIETGATSIEVGDMYVKVGEDVKQYRPEQSIVEANLEAGKWCYYERTFNSGDWTDFLLSLSNNENSIVLYDHFALYETPIAVTPEVTLDDGGNNAGIIYNVTSVMSEGQTFNATTKAYGNGTFEGWYMNDTLISTNETVTFTYDKAATYTAKYSAISKNIFPDIENRTTNGNVGDKFTGNAKYNWVSGVTPNHTIVDTENMVAGSTYGYGGTIVDDPVYAGTKAFTTPATGGHYSYQIVKVDPQSNYEINYWYKQDGAYLFASSSEAHKVTLLDYDNITNIYSDEVPAENGSEKIIHVSGTGYLYSYTDSEGNKLQDYVSTAYSCDLDVVGEWAKATFTFSTGDYEYAAIPFSQQGGTVYIDHVSCHKIPAPMTVSKGNTTGGNIIVDGKTVNSYEFAIGDTATFSYEVYPGNTFLGWYDNSSLTGEPVFTTNEVTTTATANTTLYPKVQDNNIYTNGDMENLPLGSIEDKPEYNWFVRDDQAWFSVLGEDSTNDSGVVPYSGEKMLNSSSRNNDGALWTVLNNLEKNTTYTLSFKATLSQVPTEYARLSYVGVAPLETTRPFNNQNGYKYALNIYNPSSAADPQYNLGGYPAVGWQTFTFTFNSGNLNAAKLFIGFDTDGGTIFIDDLSVTKAIAATVTSETLNAFENEATLADGGRVEVVNSIADGEYTFKGMNGTAKATLKAYPYDNNTFLGWYKGDALVSTEAIATVEFSESTEYVAKFASFGYNPTGSVYASSLGGGFEDGTKGYVVTNTNVGGVKNHAPVETTVEEATGYQATYENDSPNWTTFNYDGYGGLQVTAEEAFEGDYSLAIKSGVKGESIANKITGLTADTDYTLSFWYYIPEAVASRTEGINTNFIYYVGVGGKNYLTNRTGYPIKNDALADKYLDSSQNQSYTQYGKWTKYSINFNSGDNETVTLILTYMSGLDANSVDTQPSYNTNMYIDNVELFTRSSLATAADAAFKASAERGGVAIRASITDEQGAITVPQALRFKARIAKERFTDMTFGKDYTVVEYGTLAMKADYIEGATASEKAAKLGIGYVDAVSGKSPSRGVTYNKDSGANKIFGYVSGKNDLIFTAALTGIGKNKTGQELANAYRTEYIVRTYAIIRFADGKEVAVYDDINGTFCASVLDVANAAIIAHDTGAAILDTETLECVGAISALCENYPAQ